MLHIKSCHLPLQPRMILSAEALNKVQQFLARQTGDDIIYTHMHDHRL